MLEPADADVAFAPAFQPPGIAEVPEECGAVVVRVLLLALQLAGQDRVAAAGIDDEARAPCAAGAFVEQRLDRGTRSVEIDLAHLRAFDRQRAGLGGIAKQQFVELGTANLPGRVLGGVPAFGEVDVAAVVEVRRHELDAELRHADLLDLLAHAELVEQLDIAGQQRFADVESRVMVLLEQNHVPSFARQEGRDGGAGRPSADDEHIAILDYLHEMTSPLDQRTAEVRIVARRDSRWTCPPGTEAAS
jgi:hypothetical protein